MIKNDKKILQWAALIIILIVVGMFLDDYLNSIEHLKIGLIVLLVLLVSSKFSHYDYENKLDKADERIDNLEYELEDLRGRIFELESKDS